MASKTIYVATDGGSVANGKPSCVASWGYYGIAEDHIPQMIESRSKSKEDKSGGNQPAFFAKSGIILPASMQTTLGELIAAKNCTVLASPEKATNNIGELTAIYHALQDPAIEAADKIIIIGDSEYSLKSVDIYSRSWVKDPQKHKINEKKNLNLILSIKNRIDELRKTKQVILKHIHSHLKAPADNTEWVHWALNNGADLLCNAELEKIRPQVLSGVVKEKKPTKVKKTIKNEPILQSTQTTEKVIGN